MQIKVATLDDVEDIVGLCVMAGEESPLPYDEDAIRKNITSFLTRPMNEAVILLIPGEGVIGGFTIPSTMDHGVIAQELIWYVKNNHALKAGKIGLLLFQMFEEWAKRVGAKYVYMGSHLGVSNPVIDKFYKRNGYIEVETHYAKEIK